VSPEFPDQRPYVLHNIMQCAGSIYAGFTWHLEFTASRQKYRKWFSDERYILKLGHFGDVRQFFSYLYCICKWWLITRSHYDKLNIWSTSPKVPEDGIHFFVEDDGTVTFMPAKLDVRELKGLVPKPKKPVSVEAMNAAIKLGGSGR
jgi:hypothetical protein